MRDWTDWDDAERVLQEGLQSGAYTAACLLVGRRERVLYRRALGRLSVEDDAPPANAQTRFDLASVTKPLVVGMLSLRAIESGRLCLWDRLDTFVDAPADKRGITVGQLLTHTAGFGTGLHLWRLARSAQESAGLLLNAPLESPPGSRVRYCCAGYLLMSQLLECLYHTELSQLANREVFAPLGMTSTGYRPQEGNIAATEMQDDGRCLQGVVHDENARFLNGVAGNAGVFSTMDDLALFMQMLSLQGALPDGTRYLSPATVRLAMRNHTPGLGQARGLGFALPSLDNGFAGDLFPPQTVGHTGFTGASFALDPESGLYVVFLTNRVCPSRDSLEIYRIRRLIHNIVYARAQ